MSIEEINALQMDDVFQALVDILCNGKEYELRKDKTKTPYENLIMDNKPSLRVFKETFKTYKQSLLDSEIERLRKKDIIDRWKRLKHRKVALRSIYNVPNPKAWLRDLLNNPDHVYVDTLISEVEAAHVTITAGQDIIDEIQSDIIIGRQAVHLCERISSLVVGHNIRAEMTTVEINKFKKDFKEIIEYIKDAQPLSAKPLIEAVTGYETLKSKILELYTQAGV